MHDHYRQTELDTIDVVQDWNLNFIEGNVLKYLQRYKLKNGRDDLIKCFWYICFLIHNDRERADKMVEILTDDERWVNE